MKLELAIKSAYKKLKQHNIKSALLDSEVLMSEAIKRIENLYFKFKSCY